MLIPIAVVFRHEKATRRSNVLHKSGLKHNREETHKTFRTALIVADGDRPDGQLLKSAMAFASSVFVNGGLKLLLPHGMFQERTNRANGSVSRKAYKSRRKLLKCE
jgi:hypothetical protein